VRELFTPASNLPDGHFDLIVIGSGMGGLSSALLMAKEGFKVCVLEQHYRPGGCLHRFFRKRVPFDTGLHYLGGVGEGGTIGKYLRYLGVLDKLSFHALDPDGYDVLRFPDYEFKVPAGWEPWRKRMHEEFPAEKAKVDAFVAMINRICRESFAYSFEKPPETAREYGALSLGAFLRSLEVSPRLRAIICGQTYLYGVPPEQAPLEVHAHVVDSMMQGPVGIDGGGDALAKVMVDSIRAQGGTVRTRAKVARLELKDGEIESCVLENGERLFGRCFISNAHPHVTLDLLPEGSLRPAYVNRVREMKSSIASIGGYYTVAEEVPTRRNHNIYWFQSWDIDKSFMQGGGGFSDSKPVNDRAIFITFPSDREADWEGPRVALALGVMDWAEVEKFQSSKTGKRGPEYEAFKQRHGDELRRVVEAAVPEYAGKMKQIEVSTPLSNRDYTGAVAGGMYGLSRSTDQWGKYALTSRTKIDNLLMTGQSIMMPGVVGVTIGAFVTCSYLLGFEHVFEKVARA
jgi:all-trans-retinol 13,14-reductase